MATGWTKARSTGCSTTCLDRLDCGLRGAVAARACTIFVTDLPSRDSVALVSKRRRSRAALADLVYLPWARTRHRHLLVFDGHTGTIGGCWEAAGKEMGGPQCWMLISRPCCSPSLPLASWPSEKSALTRSPPTGIRFACCCSSHRNGYASHHPSWIWITWTHLSSERSWITCRPVAATVLAAATCVSLRCGPFSATRHWRRRCTPGPFNACWRFPTNDSHVPWLVF